MPVQGFCKHPERLFTTAPGMLDGVSARIFHGGLMSISRTTEATGDEPPQRDRQWLTLVGRRKVLAIMHSTTYAKRLFDVLSLLENDFRIQVLFTAPPHAFGREVPPILTRLGAAVVPWEKATQMEFDLALAAGPKGVADIRAPLLTLPHGANYLKRIVGEPGPSVAGLRREDIVPEGRSLPAAVVVPHHAELDELKRSCPEALHVARVTGDPAHDRIVTSLGLRETYRRALGLSDGQKLVVAVSTWGPQSSFSRFDALLPRLVSELPTAYRAALLVHPNVWSGHGAWQIRAWLARCREQGIALVPPEDDWRSVLIAADWIIGDHGSVTLYGTLTHAPILLASLPGEEINPRSPAAALAVTAPTLSPTPSLLEQLTYAAAEYRRADYAAIAARITSEPGRFNRNMRRLIYRVLGLGQPAWEPVTSPLPVPPALSTWTAGSGEVSA